MRAWVFLLAVMLTVSGTPAAADYAFDPEDLPDNYACEPDWDDARCAEEKRFEAWYNIYDARYHVWLSALLFDVNSYFADSADPLEDSASSELEERLGYATPNLVDAVYTIALRRHAGWAFAVDRNAQMRMVRLKEERTIDPAASKRYELWAPTSLAETAEPIPAFWTFEEADLTQCKGALKQLRAFPMQRGSPLWSEWELGWLSGKTEPVGDEIIVTADGDRFFVRARGVPYRSRPPRLIGAPSVVYDQWNGGEGYHWAEAMAEAARPCLKPSAATPPWEKLLAAEAKRAADVGQ